MKNTIEKSYIYFNYKIAQSTCYFLLKISKKIITFIS